MTRKDLNCIHEPFGDAFYFGPERLGKRYEHDEQARRDSGFSDATYKSIFDSIMACKAEVRHALLGDIVPIVLTASQGKQIVIKDITHYLLPPHGATACIAPSLLQENIVTDSHRNNWHTKQDSLDPTSSGTSQLPNPTVLPRSMLEQFRYAFLIRHPKHSIPSYWRCTIPPLSETTGFHDFLPSEAGYDEQRRFFDYVCQEGLAGSKVCVIDADDLLDDPEGIMRAFCENVGIEFLPEMLVWDTEADHEIAKQAFEKWPGFHCDAIDSSGLHARTHEKADLSPDDYFRNWTEKYGVKAAHVIKDTVERNTKDYEYLKQFAIKA